mgnify:CR=1 FL=1
MPENPILQRMLDRLYASLMRGPSLNARPHNSRQRIDLTLLERLGDGSASQILSSLLGESQTAQINASIKAPPGFNEFNFRRSRFKSAAPETEGDNPPPSDTTDDAQIRAYQAQRSLLTRLGTLSDDARTYEQDTGVSVLSVGYPILSLPPGFIGGGTGRILAPLAMIPVTLTVSTGVRAGVTLACREQGLDRVQPNIALMAWLERETKTPISLENIGDDEGQRPLEEIAQIIKTVAGVLNLSVSNLEQLVDPAFALLGPVPKVDDLPSTPAILPGAVLGLFPVSQQGLLRDMRDLIAEPKLEGPIRPFVDASATLVTQDHDTPDAKSTEQHRPRVFAEERFISQTDPCQAQTVRLARTETGLVIHGPPGTGKSQTIANIIGDYLSNGKRVLFVCDKRTALDVVYNRLEHLGLSRLCALIHDPQADQKDLYMAVRSRLEELPNFNTSPRADAAIAKIDAELQTIHDELLAVHRSLMSEQGQSPSFHEQMGQWLAIEAVEVEGFTPQTLTGVTMNDVEQARAELEVMFRRAREINLPTSPWVNAADIQLDAYLARNPDDFRQLLASAAEDARAADASLDDRIPPFDLQQPLIHQGQQRTALGSELAWLHSDATPELLEQLRTWDPAVIKIRHTKVQEAQPWLQSIEQSPLDAELWLNVRDSLPATRVINQQLGEIDDYLEASSSFLGFLKFSANRQGKALLRSYGLSATPDDARRLKTFLTGLRSRLLAQMLLQEFAGQQPSATPSLATDDVLTRQLTLYTRGLSATAQADAQPTLANRWREALGDTTKRQALIAGLAASMPRAESLVKLETSLANVGLFSESWLGRASQASREGRRLSPTLTTLQDRFNDLEHVLRISAGLRKLPLPLGQSVKQLALAGVNDEQALAIITRTVLGNALVQRAASDPALRDLDPQRLSRHMDRYLQLEHDKRKHVIDAIIHNWTTRQKNRLLATTGSRLNSEGANLRNRLFVRGRRAMRLRQVIGVGQGMPGGDPLFDMCPVWLASPETVAQVFPREPIFDVVIFDEASQCRLEEALPVLTRARRVVIAGDPKQLPPTRFFETSLATSEDDPIVDEQDVFEAQQSEVEDLLAAALNLQIQESYLDVHYRSHNADLIEFSNKQFYNSRLQPIPGHPHNISLTPPIAMHRVNGVYEDRTNPDEARYVCQLVSELLDQKDPPSIGIATFNLAQRDLIVELLDEMASQDAAFGRRLSAARERRGKGSFEGLFVKNLENVQGDERDHIIISTGYGPTAEGRFFKRFGPLRMAGGGRRLNVLVTRARQKVHLVTSIPREVYTANEPLPQGATPNGVWLLFEYLRFAEELEFHYDQLHKTDGQGQAPTEALVKENTIEPASSFALALSHRLAQTYRIGSHAHWGNEGFCVDAALMHPSRPNGVSIGLLTDFNRFRFAEDSVAWEVYRTAMLQSQGWELQRIWSPIFLRDPTRVFDTIMREHQTIALKSSPQS